MSDERPKGPYTLWVNYGYDGWKPMDFATLAEALEHDRYVYHDGWVIQKTVQYEISDVTPDETS